MQEFKHPQLKQFKDSVGNVFTVIPEGFNRFTLVTMDKKGNYEIEGTHLSDTDLKLYEITVPIELIDYSIFEPVHPTGVDLIMHERDRQLKEEGFTVEGDMLYEDHQLAFAAATYALPAVADKSRSFKRIHLWPWAPQWWKPSVEDRIKELKKAGALIAAEIDRLLRSK